MELIETPVVGMIINSDGFQIVFQPCFPIRVIDVFDQELENALFPTKINLVPAEYLRDPEHIFAFIQDQIIVNEIAGCQIQLIVQFVWTVSPDRRTGAAGTV